MTTELRAILERIYNEGACNNRFDFNEWLTEDREKYIEEQIEKPYTEQMRQLNEEWKGNLDLQKKMLCDKATKAFEDAVGWCRVFHWYEGVSINFRKAMEE